MMSPVPPTGVSSTGRSDSAKAQICAASRDHFLEHMDGRS